MKAEEIENAIKATSHNLKWRQIENYCSQKGYRIAISKKGYKVYVGSSCWSVHLEHRTSNELKHGIIKEFKKVLIKENKI